MQLWKLEVWGRLNIIKIIIIVEKNFNSGKLEFKNIKNAKKYSRQKINALKKEGTFKKKKEWKFVHLTVIFTSRIKMIVYYYIHVHLFFFIHLFIIFIFPECFVRYSSYFIYYSILYSFICAGIHNYLYTKSYCSSSLNYFH